MTQSEANPLYTL